jgi:hypothetical protein
MFPCQHLRTAQTRREMLQLCANGFGGLAFAGLLANTAQAASGAKPSHFPAKAKSVIFLYMDGGPGSMDTFDPKPLLTKENGQPFKMKMEPTQFDNNGNTLGSPWKFQQHGESGLWVSELFPHVAKHADKLCVLKSMTSTFSEHTAANYFLHTGSGLQGRPSMGAWFGYGLGSENAELPGFVVINGGLIPPGGLDCFGSGFLPASYQGSIFKATGQPLANIHPTEKQTVAQSNKLALAKQFDRQLRERWGAQDPIDSAISNAELAFKMQTAVPEVANLDQETAATKQGYGFDAEYKPTQTFARQCLLARRLVEQGVRFVELTCPAIGGNDRWDAHGNLQKNHETNALAVDQPIGALLGDLADRGLLDSTLVLWGGEFGRTPFAQGSNGRDHNPFGYSMWLAGGGVKGGMTYGATDEYGYKVVENKLLMHDLHATILHLLGMDHTKLTFRFGGRDMRLTDVHGEIIKPILA